MLEPGDEATFLLHTPYLLLHVPVQPHECYILYTAYMCDNIIRVYVYMYVYTCPTSVNVSPHDT